MGEIKDVHTEHCCAIHGCKYRDPCCTVTTGKAPQSYDCEDCMYDREAIKEAQEKIVDLYVYTSFEEWWVIESGFSGVKAGVRNLCKATWECAREMK